MAYIVNLYSTAVLRCQDKQTALVVTTGGKNYSCCTSEEAKHF